MLDDEFAAWLDAQEAPARIAILAHARLLAEVGSGLGRPYAAPIDEAG